MSLMKNQCRLCANEQKLRLLPCMHELCADCVVKIYQQSRSVRCPWCRHVWRLPGLEYMPIAKPVSTKPMTDSKTKKSKNKSSVEEAPSEELVAARQGLRDQFLRIYQQIIRTQTDDVVGSKVCLALRKLATEAAGVYHSGTVEELQNMTEHTKQVADTTKPFPRISAARNVSTADKPMRRVRSDHDGLEGRESKSSGDDKSAGLRSKGKKAVREYTQKQRQLRDQKLGWTSSAAYTPSKMDSVPTPLNKYDLDQQLQQFRRCHFTGDSPVPRTWFLAASDFIASTDDMKLEALPELRERAALRDTQTLTWVPIRHALNVWKMVGGGRPLVSDIQSGWDVLKDESGEVVFIKACLFIQPGDVPRKAWLAQRSPLQEALKVATGFLPLKAEFRGDDSNIGLESSVSELHKHKHTGCINVFRDDTRASHSAGR